MRGTEVGGPLELAGITIDRDDLRRAGQAGTGDGGVADTAAADHRDTVAADHAAGVHRGTMPGHDAASEQSHHGRICIRGDLGALALVNQRLVGERADTQRRGQRGAIGQRHRLARIVGVETVLRPAAFAGPAFAAHRTPVQDHEVAGLDEGDLVTDGLDDARGLVTEQERVFVVDPTLAVGQIGVAYAARLDLHHHIAWRPDREW